NRLDQIAARLLDGERCQLAVVERSFVHHAVDRKRELPLNLLDRKFRYRRIATPLMGEQPVGVLDRTLAAFRRDIHQPSSITRTDRGKAATAAGAAKMRSMPHGNRRRLAAIRSAISGGSGSARSTLRSRMPGPVSTKLVPVDSESTCSTTVVEQSG